MFIIKNEKFSRDSFHVTFLEVKLNKSLRFAFTYLHQKELTHELHWKNEFLDKKMSQNCLGKEIYFLFLSPAFVSV